ncbi:ral guanine nucleotide dissociation stimulator-like [Tamandua tetradactyla]|uniref:ral guanine nucleotide dissociation stimulator-like n=1 Tax=Tamandua tetradactyla TaxID=48850 RepID=UPI0040539176
MDFTGEMKPKRQQESPLCESDYQLILRIQLFQLGWTSIHFRPLEQFGAWFGAVEQLTKLERLSEEALSCGSGSFTAALCPVATTCPVSRSTHPCRQTTHSRPQDSQMFSNLRAPSEFPLPSSHQETIIEPSSSGTSPPSDQLLSGHNFSIGDAAASLPGHVFCTSNPDLEISMGPVTKFPGRQEKQEPAHPCSLKYAESILSLCLELSGFTAASCNSTSSVAYPSHVAPVSPQRASDPQLFYIKKKVGDHCIIHVSLDGDSSTVYKSVLVSQVTCDDRAPAVICKALTKYHLEEEAPQDYELIQIICKHQSLNIPLNTNIFYGMDPFGNYNFILSKQTFPLGMKNKKRGCSTLLHRKRKGLKVIKDDF